MNQVMPIVLVLWLIVSVAASFLGACDSVSRPQYYARALLWPLFLVIWLLRGLLLALAEDLGLRKKGA